MSTELLARTNLPNLLCRIVEEKLKISGALSLVKKAGFGNNPLALSSDNSLLLEFQGPVPNAKFRMMVSFLPVDFFTSEALAKLLRVRDLLWYDLAIFWTTSPIGTLESQALKAINVQALTVLPPDKIGIPFQQIPDFIHVPNLPYDELLELNLLANEIVKRLRKKFHLVLSELAADTYDDYGTFATKEVMHYEDDLLGKAFTGVLQNGKGHLAIDVGCGNGRHSRVLAKHFSEVIAFDLSKRMIGAARDKDRGMLLSQTQRQISYYECDVEYEEFPDESAFTGKADFVCASFGMPSFVEDTAAMLRRFYKWLRPEGKALLTFYNSKSLALAVKTPWKERALSASIDLARNALEVELREGVRFSIYCKPLDALVKETVAAYFTIEGIFSFPHLLALMPPSIFGSDEEPQSVARDVFVNIDRTIAEKSEVDRGHYMFMIVRKERSPREGYLRVLSALEHLEIDYTILDHQPVVSTKDVSQILRLEPEAMVKTVILKCLKDDRYIVALIPPTRRVDVTRLATAVGVDRKDIILAPPVEIEREFGFPIGGIPPLGFEESKRVTIFVDPVVRSTQADYIYMGVGDNSKTLRLSNQAFLQMVSEYQVTPITFEA